MHLLIHGFVDRVVCLADLNSSIPQAGWTSVGDGGSPLGLVYDCQSALELGLHTQCDHDEREDDIKSLERLKTRGLSLIYRFTTYRLTRSI